MSNIPFIDLQSQQLRIKENIDQNIQKVLKHGKYINGPEIQELEEKLAKFVGVKHCISCSSGTDALIVPLMAWGIGPGDEVITSPFSFIATAEVISLLGAKPVFVDIDPNTYNLDINQIESVITSNTKAIIPVSIFGQMPDMAKIIDLGQANQIKVLEDGCQSFGATHQRKKSCSFNDAGVTSFFPSKPLGCYGDGGAIFTDDDSLAQSCQEIKSHGQTKRYQHGRIGLNARMDTLQAAIVLAKFEIFPQEISLRHLKAENYRNLLTENEGIILPSIKDENTSVFAQYSIQVENRKEVIESLNAKDIPTAIHYPTPLHLQPAFNDLIYREGDFPIAESVSKKIMSIPMSPYLKEEDQKIICHALKETI